MRGRAAWRIPNSLLFIIHYIFIIICFDDMKNFLWFSVLGDPFLKRLGVFDIPRVLCHIAKLRGALSLAVGNAALHSAEGAEGAYALRSDTSLIG